MYVYLYSIFKIFPKYVVKWHNIWWPGKPSVEYRMIHFKWHCITVYNYNINLDHTWLFYFNILIVYYFFSKIGILAEELLFEILFYLSSAYLEINRHWPGGIDMFRNQMVWSFKSFPKTPKDLCFVLTNCKNIDTKNLIIIFIYFYLLTCSK